MQEKCKISLSDTWVIYALTLLFVAFKLAKIIDWSWWWILSPIWIPLAGLLFIIVIAAICGTLAAKKEMNSMFKRRH
mgnify:CR=1 FL=1